MDYISQRYLDIRNLCSNIPDSISLARKDIFNKENKGDSLYLYYDVDLINEISNRTHQLWFKNVKTYTDREENDGWFQKYFYILLELDDEIKQKNGKKYDHCFRKIVKDSICNYKIERLSNRYYVLCFSYEPDNNTCWNTFLGKSFYANEIKINGENKSLTTENENEWTIKGNFLCTVKKNKTHGGCICFNKSGLDCYLNQLTKISGFVNYDKKCMTNKFFKCLDSIYAAYQENNNINVKESIWNIMDIYNLFLKNDFYSGEKEYRYVIDKSCFKSDKTRFIEYSEKNDAIIYTFNTAVINHITITNSDDANNFEKYDILLSKISYNEENLQKGFKYE